jgi:hypothetical protein
LRVGLFVLGAAPRLVPEDLYRMAELLY